MPSSDNFSPVLLIHGGAGTTSKIFPEEEQQKYLNSLRTVLRKAGSMLAEGRSALDIVENAVVLLEDDPLFNAGKGAVFNLNGEIELEASIMNGKDGNAGACTLVKHVKNPIKVARVVMEKTEHVFIASPKAEALAKENGLEMVETSYFFTQKRCTQHKRGLEFLKEATIYPKGTVGAVCLDKFGNLAAATSTGGRNNKVPQRIGDTPLIGAGNYAENGVCAISGTGHGDFFIRHVLAYDIASRIKYGKQSVVDASKDALNIMKNNGGDGGVIVVDSAGNVAMEFSSDLMFRGIIRVDGEAEVNIF